MRAAYHDATMSGLSATPITTPAGSAVDVVDTAIAELRSGRLVIVVDDESAESEGDFVCAAQYCDARAVAFMRQHGSGVVAVPMTAERIGALGIPPMTDQADGAEGHAYSISVDARSGWRSSARASGRARG